MWKSIGISNTFLEFFFKKGLFILEDKLLSPKSLFVFVLKYIILLSIVKVSNLLKTNSWPFLCFSSLYLSNRNTIHYLAKLEAR